MNPTDFAKLPTDLNSRIDSAQKRLESLRQSLPKEPPLGLVVHEGGVPTTKYEGFHNARIHIRGSYARLGREVKRHAPLIVGGDQTASTEGSGRFELARWIVSPKNPLAARVTVNRIWQYHMGEGIVRTPSNFGKLGRPPSHPELLDYLASRFLESGWSIKKMHRMIMLTSVYQQSSKRSSESVSRDPENLLWSGMNLRRLEAEAVRDTLFAVSGRLDPLLGGPPFDDLGTPRRTLYLRSIRSDRSSFAPLFDGADAAGVVDTRTVSTVAPQALFLLNSAMVDLASKAFAERLTKEAESAEKRIELAYQLLFSRSPSNDERSIALSLLGAGAAGQDSSQNLIALCHVLMCTNELVYID